MNSVYFILGTPNSGRRAIVRDLVENGLAAEERALVLLARGESPVPADAALAKLKNVEIRRWAWAAPNFPDMELPEGATVFLLADPQADQIDQLEALKPWLASHGAGLARIFCVVDCGLAEKNPVLRQWFDACIHFADVVFLTRREGLPNKWLSDFIKHFKEERYPCHFVQVKAKGDLATPLVWLDPTARRVSQYFDDEEPLPDIEIETDDEEDDEEDSGLPPPEPYFVRQASGRRDKELPDVREFFPKK
ncbi:MAG TPA: hypothetical protein VG734_17325 [Lacunisphaera sp.]|nr:hypothetical protein [Lacunisphaera sp.]